MSDYAAFHRRSIEDRDGFWREQAELIDWQTPFGQVSQYDNPPFAKWFVGGRTNLCHNAVDRHLKDRADQPALIWVSTEVDQEIVYSFRQLHDEVQRADGQAAKQKLEEDMKKEIKKLQRYR